MMGPKRIYVVASQAPRVGKTFVVRLLTEFFKYTHRRVIALDLGHDESAKDDSEMTYDVFSEIDTTLGQMKFFERLLSEDEGIRVVDVGSENLAKMVRLGRKVDFF